MRRESCTSKAHNTAKADLLNNGLVVFRNSGHKCVSGVNTLGPLITLNGNLNVRCGTAGQIGTGADGLYRTGNGRMDEGAHKAAGLSNHLAHLHLVANSHAGNGGSADVLRHGDVHRGCNRQGCNGAAPGDLTVVRMHSAD